MPEMIDDEKRQSIRTSLKTSQERVQEVLDTLTDEDLKLLKRVLRSDDAPKALSELNLEHELITQFTTVKGLQEDVMEDDSIAANQRAQVANTVASTLQQLVKMQTEFYTAERFKAVEGLMLKAIRKLPKEIAESFVSEYERMGT
jgi:hypothetical protein